MINITKIPRHILRDVRDFVTDNNLARCMDGTTDVDGYIASMTHQEFVDAWLKWNGIIGWTEVIMSVVDKAREASK